MTQHDREMFIDCALGLMSPEETVLALVAANAGVDRRGRHVICGLISNFEELAQVFPHDERFLIAEKLRDIADRLEAQRAGD